MLLLLLLLYIQIKEGTVPLATRPLFLKVQVDAVGQFRACAVGRRARTGGASDDSEPFNTTPYQYYQMF